MVFCTCVIRICAYTCACHMNLCLSARKCVHTYFVVRAWACLCAGKWCIHTLSAIMLFRDLTYTHTFPVWLQLGSGLLSRLFHLFWLICLCLKQNYVNVNVNTQHTQNASTTCSNDVCSRRSDQGIQQQCMNTHIHEYIHTHMHELTTCQQ